MDYCGVYDEWEDLEPFERELVEYGIEYHKHLLNQFTVRTAEDHSIVIRDFIFFVIHYKEVEGFEGITVGMSNSEFLRHYNSEATDPIQKQTCKNVLKKFFLFIQDKYQIRNPILIQGFEKK